MPSKLGTYEQLGRLLGVDPWGVQVAGRVCAALRMSSPGVESCNPSRRRVESQFSIPFVVTLSLTKGRTMDGTARDADLRTTVHGSTLR